MRIIHATKERTETIPIDGEVLYTEGAVIEIIDRVLMARDSDMDVKEILKKRPREWL